jgi:hypothetical protein
MAAPHAVFMQEATMQATDKRDSISLVWTSFGLAALVVAAVLLNVYPGYIGVRRITVNPVTFEGLFAPGFVRYLPMLNLWFTCCFALVVAKLVEGRWTPLLRWSAVVLRLVLAGQPISMAAHRLMSASGLGVFAEDSILSLLALLVFLGILPHLKVLLGRMTTDQAALLEKHSPSSEPSLPKR